MRQGIILLDGADGTGKTTLAGKLKERIEKDGGLAHIKHQPKPERGTCWDIHSQALLDYIKLMQDENCVIIADRHFISESIYGRVYRDGSEYPLAARHIDRLMHRFNTLRVVCAPPIEYVVETHAKLKEERHEDYNDGMDAVAQCYHDLWFGGKIAGHTYHHHRDDYVTHLTLQGGVADLNGWYRYDVTTDGKDMDAYMDMLLNEFDRNEELFYADIADPTKNHYSGRPHKQAVLLVGDCCNGPNDLMVPFYANKNSSLYLANVLHQLQVDEGRIVMANINDPNGLETVRELANRCGRVIAMGREAERAMEIEEIPFHARVYHPQHARRFNLHTRNYVSSFQEALQKWAGAL